MGKEVINNLDRMHEDEHHVTQNLERALDQIEGCQNEMQNIKHKIIQEEQQLRTILSPLNQSDDSERHEQVSPIISNLAHFVYFLTHNFIEKKSKNL